MSPALHGVPLAASAAARTEGFGLAVLVVGVALGLAVLSNRASERTRVPAPAFFLVGAAVGSNLAGVPAIGVVRVQQVVTVALVMVLFDGGMHIGARRLRSALGPVLAAGVGGTVLTAAALAAAGHLLLGVGWRSAFLLGTALAPTDPAVVFSVLGRREVAGRTGIILEGESGANDPVGIALLLALLDAGHGGAPAILGSTVATFALQMAVGIAVGAAGGLVLLQLVRRLPLPSAGLYPLRTLAAALLLYGAATVAHGSGFLAVFVAGIVFGDARAPYKAEITRFHSSLASLGEIVAFAVLGVTVHLGSVYRTGALVAGAVIALLLTLLIRPVLLTPLLLPARLRRGEQAFVLWSGLKGAVPILLGTYLLSAGIGRSERLYDVIFVVVTFSVIVQGTSVPLVARRLGVPMHTVEPEPWSLGVRFRHEPEGLLRMHVQHGSVAAGRSLSDLPLDPGVWVSIVIRGGRLVPVSGETVLQPGDDVLLLADPAADVSVGELFRRGGRPARDVTVGPSRPDEAAPPLPVIRQIRDADLPQLRVIEARAGSLFGQIGMQAVAEEEPAGVSELTRFLESGRAWVVTEDGDSPVGYLLADIVDGTGYIAQVCVDPSVAHRRLGKRLVEHAAGWARRQGLPALTLTTFADVPWNGPYYERLGFRRLAPDEIGPGLAAIRRAEAGRGLDTWPRICMRRDL
jgi:cell volume regulation protein A